MKLILFNSLTKKKEEFKPLAADQIKMYVCGPTVYDRPHIGNARSVVCYDILYRVLQYIYGKEKILYVRNITDIDDKIINRARDDKITILELTQKVTKWFHDDMDYLHCLRPNHEPKATEHLEEIVDIIQRLLDRGYAYISGDHVYFDVAKYADYTRLSGQSESNLFESVRIEQSAGKRNPNDFVLWKPVRDEAEKFASFDSPFGEGRPGWHIECSAMSYKFLGQNFDIHGGGADLIFPHHTNEVAQSCCAFPGSKYANFWVHNGFLTVEHEKMSKSLGNFLTVKDLIDQGIKGEVLRLILMSTHYRKPLDYNNKLLNDSNSMLDYWYRAMEIVDANLSDKEINLPQEFLEALSDDLNIHQAVTITHEFAKKVHSSQDVSIKNDNYRKLYSCARFLGFFNHTAKEWFCSGVNEQEINALVERRNAAKLAKNWSEADKIRDELAQIGVVLEDKAGGITIWKIIK